MYAGSLPHFLLGRLARWPGVLSVALVLTVVVLLAFGASGVSAAGTSQPDPNILWPYRW
jgi:hypothetical protein